MNELAQRIIFLINEILPYNTIANFKESKMLYLVVR